MIKILEALIKVEDDKGHIRFLRKDDVIIKIKSETPVAAPKESVKEKKSFTKKFYKK